MRARSVVPCLMKIAFAAIHGRRGRQESLATTVIIFRCRYRFSKVRKLAGRWRLIGFAIGLQPRKRSDVSGCGFRNSQPMQVRNV